MEHVCDYLIASPPPPVGYRPKGGGWHQAPSQGCAFTKRCPNKGRLGVRGYDLIPQTPSFPATPRHLSKETFYYSYHRLHTTDFP